MKYYPWKKDKIAGETHSYRRKQSGDFIDDFKVDKVVK